jgi:glyoxylase-like metal-dependent hydrolase (beta-lactamase superfamily II)
VAFSGWREVAAEVYVRTYQHLAINISVVRGGDELLVVDSRSSPTEAAELETDLKVFAPARVRMLVNTHAHFDHTFGNQQFGPGSALDVPIYGHRLLPAHLEEHEGPRLAAWRANPAGEPERGWDDVRITPPTCLVATKLTLTVGGRLVDLHPADPGHTDTDLFLHVPDSHVWIVGDIVEASGPPMYGSGCYPLDLPGQLAGLLAQLEDGDVIVPGHGTVVDRVFVAAQMIEVDRLAQQLRASYLAGDTVAQALEDPERWPFPVEGLGLAVQRAFQALGQAEHRVAD